MKEIAKQVLDRMTGKVRLYQYQCSCGYVTAAHKDILRHMRRHTWARSASEGGGGSHKFEKREVRV